MDLSAATRFASSAGATEVALEELKGLAAAGVFGGFLWDANADKNGILMGFSMGFLWFSMLKKNNETELELKWDFDGMDMWF